MEAAIWRANSVAGKGLLVRQCSRPQLIHFGLKLERDGQDPILLDIDHPTVPPESPFSFPTPLDAPRSPDVVLLTRSTRLLNRDPQAWVSPAFLKRKELLSTPILNSIYDPLRCGGDYRETSPSKRTKFGRKSGEWRYASQSSSPVEEVDTTLDEEYRALQEVEDKDAAVQESNVHLQAPASVSIDDHLETHQIRDEKALDALISTNGEISSETKGEEFSREVHDEENLVQDSICSDSSSQALSPLASNVDFELIRHKTPIQDTYDSDTWSTSRSLADPSMKATTDALYSVNHVNIHNLSSAEESPVSSPAQVLSSPDRLSRPNSSSSKRSEPSQNGFSMRCSHLDGEDIGNEPHGEEPFSRRSYIASESSGRSDMDSEDTSLLRKALDDSGDDERRIRPIRNNQQDMVAPFDSPPSSPQSFDHGYDGSMISRARSRAISLPSAEEQADDPTTVTDLQAKTVLEGRTGEGGVAETEYERVLNSPGFAQVIAYHKQQSRHQTRAVLPSGHEPGTSQKTDDDEITLAFQHEGLNSQRTDDSFDQRDQGSIRLNDSLGGNKAILKPHTGAIESDIEGVDMDYQADSISGHRALSQPARTAKRMEVGSLPGEDDMENVQDQDDSGSQSYSMADARSVSFSNGSHSKPIEIIDVDEYEALGSHVEQEDAAQSEEGDYWSDEVIQDPERFGLESIDDDDLIEEQEIGAAEEDYEENYEQESEEDYVEEYEEVNEEYYEEQEASPDALEQSGHGQTSWPKAKTPKVEIIDLESDDEVEPPQASTVNVEAPQVSNLVPDVKSALIEESALALGREERGEPTEPPQQGLRQEPKIEAKQDTSQRVPTFAKSPTAKAEVRDTYSEDGALSDTEASEGVLVVKRKDRSEPHLEFTGHSVHLTTTTQEAELSPALSITADRHAWEEKGRARPGVDATITQSSLSPQQEATLTHRNPEVVRLLHSPGQGLTSFPSHRPVAPPQISATEVKGLQGPTDEEAHHMRTALEDITMDRDEAIPNRGGEEFSEQETKELSMQDLRDELTQRSQLLTPSDTQTTKVVREQSDLCRMSQDEQDTLPTPSLTQRTSEFLLPITPLPRKPSLIEQLKEMRSDSARKRQSGFNNQLPIAVSPWFGTSRSSQVGHSSDQESIPRVEEETGRDGDVSSESEQSELDQEPSLPRRRAVSPPLSPVFARLPSSSPPPRPEPDSGFRTSLAYFAPLSTIRSHYNSTTSVLALVIASTPITRATAGPKDYHMTLYITDPSSASPPSMTSARIFRPSRFSFPDAQQGDAILLRNFRVVSYKKQLGLLSTDSSAWAVFRRGEEPQIRGPPVEFGAEERGFARGHWDWWATVEQDKYVNAVPSDKAESPRRTRGHKSGNSRSSIVRHELRDGTTYVDRPKVENTEMHELRDGTQWSDSKL